jgi:hypothetical protein
MRKHVVIGSVCAVVLIMMVPVVSAVEWNAVETAVSSVALQQPSLQSMLKQKDQDPQPTCIVMFLTALILFLKFVRFIRHTMRFSGILVGLVILLLLKHFSA